MEIGIITKSGKFINCPKWGHIPTAARDGTEAQFLVCRNNTVDIVGGLNPLQYEALLDYCTRNCVQVEDVASSDLDDALMVLHRRGVMSKMALSRCHQIMH